MTLSAFPPFTQPGLKSVPAIQTQHTNFSEDETPLSLSPVIPPAIINACPSDAALRVIERAADRAIGSTVDRIGNKIKFKASSAVGLLTTQLEQARKVKARQDSVRRALGEGSKSMPGKGKNKVPEAAKTPSLLVILKSAVIRAGSNDQQTPIEVSTKYMRDIKL